MDTIIKLSSAEFNEELFKKIRAFLNGRNAHITIAVTDISDTPLRKENTEEYWDRLNKSIEDIEQGKGITFTMKELEEFITK